MRLRRARLDFIELVEVGGDVIEALRPQEKAVARAARPFCNGEVFPQRRVGIARRKAEVASAALGVEAAVDRDRLDERRLAGAVLPHEEGHLLLEFQPPEMPHHREGKDVALLPLRDRTQLHRTEIERVLQHAPASILRRRPFHSVTRSPRRE